MLQKKMYPRYLIILALVVYLVFYITPSLIGVIYSFTDMTIYKPKDYDFVGLQNYINLIKQNRFVTGLTNTFTFMILTTFFKIVVGFGLALILNLKLKSRNVLRTVFYLPVILSTIIVSEVFKAMLLPDTGLINQFLGLFSENLGHWDWLGSKETAMYVIIFVDAWKGTGYCMVIFLAGLQAVPQECYEAAALDGATSWKRFWLVTLPLMIPSVSITVLFSVIGGLKVFDIIIVMTNGGPGMSTQVLNTTIYSYFGSGALSTGCAANVLMTILVIFFFWAVKKVFSYWEAKNS